MPWIAHRPPGILAEICQHMAKLVRKLKPVLSPVGVSGSQTYRDAAVCLALEVGYRMIRSMVHVDTRKLRARAISPNLARGRLQNSSDIRGTHLPEPCQVDMDARRLDGTEFSAAVQERRMRAK